jgi:hypothetical protein
MITVGTVSGCSQPALSAQPTAAAPTAGLVKALHQRCDVGSKVMNYLATGNNGGDPQLDVLLAKYVGVDAPQARAIADQQIQECDANLSRQDAAQASAAAAAQASASAVAVRASQDADRAAAEAAVKTAREKSCTSIGGRVDTEWSWCASTVKGNASGRPGADCTSAEVAFNQDGSLAEWSSSSAKETWPGCFRL